MLSSPRFRRRLRNVGLPVLALGAIVLAAVVWGNSGRDEYRNSRPATAADESTAPPAPPRYVVLTSARREAALATARKFLQTAVARENVSQSWPLVHPTLRQGLTRREWATGSIPIVPYPLDVARWRLGYSTATAVGFEVLLLPAAGSSVQPQVFDIELTELGSGKAQHWLVSSWAPRSGGIFQRPPSSPAREAAEAQAVTESQRNAVGAGWLLLPIGAMISIIVVLPAFLLARDWRRRRSAERSYREHQAMRERESPGV